MEKQFILTPFFVGEPEPGLETVATDNWLRNTPPLPTADTPQAKMTILYRQLASLVETTVRQNRLPVSVCGDCLSSIGVLAGLQRGGIHPTLIWFDAHGDFNTWETSPSGFLGGMPLAMLVGRGEQTIVNGVGLAPLPEARVILTDARDLDPGEREVVAASAVLHLPHAETLRHYPLPPGPLYVHFDVDVINPIAAPAMRYTAPGGPSVETLRAIFRRLASTGQVMAVSLSAWDTTQDDGGESATVAMNLLNDLVA